MPVIVVANPKGGVGKSTVSSQIAGYYAHQGRAVMLGDADRQESARLWLSLRPPELPRISTWEIERDRVARPPKGTTHAVIDTPSGLHGWRLDAVLKAADKLVVPLSPSIFDIYATQDFLARVGEHTAGRSVDVGLVGVRVDPRTRAAEQLQAFVAQTGLPLLATLRPTTLYAHMAAHGLSLWDVRTHRVDKDLEQWVPLLAWLDAPATARRG